MGAERRWKGEWPPELWNGFRAWTGMRMNAWRKGVPKPALDHHPQLVLKRAKRTPIPLLAPSLGLLTTGRDMGRLMIALVNGGKYKGSQVCRFGP